MEHTIRRVAIEHFYNAHARFMKYFSCHIPFGRKKASPKK
jgi:hypothetical protein